jgi:hypothetical protein
MMESMIITPRDAKNAKTNKITSSKSEIQKKSNAKQNSIFQTAPVSDLDIAITSLVYWAFRENRISDLLRRR